jgi:uncharacterized protein DUF3105
MLAGMLSVLLVAGIIGLGVFLATDEPSAAPQPTTPATTSARAPDTGQATPTATAATEPLPPVKIRTLEAAAKAAGCQLENPPVLDAKHEQREFTKADYNSNPPTSGTHFPEWYEDGVYAPGTTPQLGMLVHTLEHGRIDLQYTPGTPAATVSRLEKLVDELDNGYHMLLFENGTEMPYAVAATAWGHLLGCPTMNDKVFDAVRAFRKNYVDKGPEIIP